MASSPQFRAGKIPPRRTGRVTAAETTPEIARYKTLVSRVVDAFGDEIKASQWLSQPNPELDGQTPLQVVQGSGYDIHLLEPVLIRIEHGIDY